jgi:hypothetical protein
MLRHLSAVLIALGLLVPAAVAQTPPKVDITGKWTATFETQVGTQTYTYDFVVKDGVVSGKITSSLGAAVMQPGKVEGDKVTFGETLTFMEMELPITYAGQITSPDEIKFSRNVAEFATEELVAKRVKP